MKTRTLLLAMIVVINSIGLLWLASREPEEQPPQIVQPVPPTIPPVEPPKEYTFDDALKSISVDELKKNLTYLASDELEGRMSGKKGNITAFDFIKKEYEKCGLPTMYHKFTIQRMNPGPQNETGDDFTQNCYAWIEGNDPLLKDEIVVIGAHGDHIGYGPRMSRSNKIAVHNGADDNGTGTVALLQVAKAFSMLKGKVRRTVVFQSYSAEEMGLIGSKFYCNNPVFPQNAPSIGKHVAMINLDMVGYLGRGQYFAGFDHSASSVDLSGAITELNGKYSFAKQITSRGSGGSDHAPFYNKKVPVAFLHTGLHPYYHTPEDDVERINFDGLQKVSTYAFELAWKVAQADSRPKFNYAAFKEMPYTHDHGHGEVFVKPKE